MIKIVTVLGARPQFIKAAAVSRIITAYNTAAVAEPVIREIVVHTGQHYNANMSDVFFAELGMEKPTYQLDIHGGSHGEMTGRMLIEIEKILQVEKPDAVLVYGDTNSTLAGSLAAIKMQIPVAHVEAGLRSFNMSMPEEINRVLTDRISRWLFTPTTAAAQNLVREGFRQNQILPVGDVMYDVALHYSSAAVSETGLFRRLGLKQKNYILATIHRAENTDNPDRLAVIVTALSAVAKDIPVVWPMHPRTSKVLSEMNYKLSPDLTIIDPLGYLDMVQLEKNASLIATDSGGVQKEAFFYKVPCVTLRDETEWIELVEARWNRLAPPLDTGTVLSALYSSIGSKGEGIEPYGLGNAAKLIVDHLFTELR